MLQTMAANNGRQQTRRMKMKVKPKNVSQVEAEEELVSIPEAARMVKHAERTIRWWIQQGRIASHKFGGGAPGCRAGRRLVPMSDIQARRRPPRALPLARIAGRAGRRDCFPQWHIDTFLHSAERPYWNAWKPTEIRRPPVSQ
jgi:hypothetical protein